MALRTNSSALRTTIAVILAATLAGGSEASYGHDDPDRPAKHELADAVAGLTPGPAWTQPMKTENFTVVGHSDVGGRGLNGDVWFHRGHAYVGESCRPRRPTGVKVVDVRRPSSPQVVSRLRNLDETRAEDLAVRSVATPHFTGDLAVVGIQVCTDTSSFQGLELWDVTEPAEPVRLSRWRSASAGCHEVDLTVHSGGRVLAGCAQPFAELVADTDEVAIVDVTDPTRPDKVGGFALLRDTGIDPRSSPPNVGCYQRSYGHSVRFADRGRTLYVSYFDAGTFRLDVLESGRLRRVNRIDLAPPDEDADNHSISPARRGSVVVINSEDFSPALRRCRGFGSWGQAHVFTNTRGRPRHLSTFGTPNSRSSRRTDAAYSVHNTEVFRGGTEAMSSWYSDGIVWWSLKNPRRPRMRGQFVPPPTEDPTGSMPPIPMVWGVALDPAAGLVFATDMNSGLWILRPTGLRD